MDEILDRFLAQAPIAVMVHATATRALAASTLDEIFERNSDGQYTRDLAFSSLVRLMTKVVFQTYPSVHAAYRGSGDIPVSVASVYNKLNGIGTELIKALVAETAATMRGTIDALPWLSPGETVEGLRLRTLDGNFLAGTDHRLACLRGSGAAALPGMALVVRDGRTGLLTDIVPCEDAYTNERALNDTFQLLVEPDDLWMADRNFCTEDFLGGIEASKAFYLIRHHCGSKLHPLGPETARRKQSDGAISEQSVRVGMLECRCIIIHLSKPTEDGTTEIRLLTNAPIERLSALRASSLYRSRWRIESAFQELTLSLRCEINTLGYPKAALFGFALAIVAYNIMVLTRSGLASGVGEEVGEADGLSSFHMATEVAAVGEGLRIAVPQEVWDRFAAMTVPEFASWLDEVSRGINWTRYRKSPRGPKKPVTVNRTRRGAHRSTAREIKNSQG